MPCALVITHIQDPAKTKKLLDDFNRRKFDYRGFSPGAYAIKGRFHVSLYIEDLNRQVNIDPGDVLHIFNLYDSGPENPCYCGLDLQDDEVADWIEKSIRHP